MQGSSPPLSPFSSSVATTTGSNNRDIVTQYRSAHQLPFELRQHVQIYLEEQLFTQALSFLTSLVSSSASSFDSSNPVLTPTPSHLAIIATLAVHPTFTSRTTSKEKWEQAHAALRLIKLINKVIGPVNARLSEAFSFTKYDHRSSRNGRRDVHSDEDDAAAQRKANTPYATSESLWTRAEDFWHIVGWAFNCSCLEEMYASRWEYWSLWLDTMLEVLERDWRIRYSENECEESLIGQYVGIIDVGQAHYRRVMRAIFANSGSKSRNEFREIFRNELKPPKSDAAKFKKRQVDVKVDEEIYGDYLVNHSDSSSDDEPLATTTASKRSQRTRTPSSRRLTPRTSNSSIRSTHSNMSLDDLTESTTSKSSTLGGPHSLHLRLRLLHLLSHLAGAIPESFMELDELYILFVEFIRPLPLSIFQQIISPSTAAVYGVWSIDAQTTLCEFLLSRMLESAASTSTSKSAPSTTATAGTRFEEESKHITQQKLLRASAPWAASKPDVVSQAKASLLIESLLRLLLVRGKLVAKGADLKEAIVSGIQRRLERVIEGGEVSRSRKRKGRGGDVVSQQEEEAWKWLVESGERMTLLVSGVEQ